MGFIFSLVDKFDVYLFAMVPNVAIYQKISESLGLTDMS